MLPSHATFSEQELLEHCLRKSAVMRRVSRSVTLFFAFPLAGCLPVVVPVPVPPETTSAAGKIGDLDLEDIQPGVTRDEIEKKLADIKIDCGTSRVFWGRWQSSRLAIAFTYGKERIRKVHNLVLEFDESGKVLRRHDVDDKGLIPALTTSMKHVSIPPLNESNFAMSATRDSTKTGMAKGTLKLTGGGFMFEDTRNGRNLSVPLSAIGSLTSSVWPYYEDGSHISHELIAITFHLSTKSAAGKGIQLGIRPTDVWTLVRWFEQVKSARPS